jgi:hypothetical protein
MKIIFHEKYFDVYSGDPASGMSHIRPLPLKIGTPLSMTPARVSTTTHNFGLMAKRSFSTTLITCSPSIP